LDVGQPFQAATTGWKAGQLLTGWKACPTGQPLDVGQPFQAATTGWKACPT
jgi:hypothetical protein